MVARRYDNKTVFTQVPSPATKQYSFDCLPGNFSRRELFQKFETLEKLVVNLRLSNVCTFLVMSLTKILKLRVIATLKKLIAKIDCLSPEEILGLFSVGFCLCVGYELI